MRFKHFVSGFAAAVILASFGGSVFADSDMDRYQEMYRLRSEGSYLECVTLADSLISENPYDMRAYTNKSLAAYQYGDFTTSYETLEKQLSLNPYNQIALYNKACLASVITDYNTVTESIKLLLDMDISAKKLIMQDSDFVNCHENEYMVNMLFNPSIRVCGTVLDPSAPPIEQNERLLVPIRPVIEAMGAVVEWNPDDNSFAVIMDGKNLIMQIGSNIAKLNGEVMEVELAPVLRNERTYVPVRFVAENMGFDVEWDENLALADIYTKLPSGNLSVSEFRENNNSKIDISAVSGLYIEPYMLENYKGIIMLVMNDKAVLDEFNNLSASDKSEYLKTMALENTELISDNCKNVNVKLVFENKTFYSMDYSYESGECGKLRYFKNGLLTNVVKQLKAENNYMDYYIWKSLNTENSYEV